MKNFNDQNLDNFLMRMCGWPKIIIFRSRTKLEELRYHVFWKWDCDIEPRCIYKIVLIKRYLWQQQQQSMQFSHERVLYSSASSNHHGWWTSFSSLDLQNIVFTPSSQRESLFSVFTLVIFWKTIEGWVSRAHLTRGDMSRKLSASCFELLVRAFLCCLKSFFSLILLVLFLVVLRYSSLSFSRSARFVSPT